MANEQELNIRIRLLAEQFTQGIQKVKSQLGGFQKDIEKTTQGTQKGGFAAVNALKSLEAPIAQAVRSITRLGFIIVSTFGVAIKSVNDAGNEISDFEKKSIALGISVDALSKKIYGFNVASTNTQIGVNRLKLVGEQLHKYWVSAGSVLGNIFGAATKYDLAKNMFFANPKAGWANALKTAEKDLMNEEKARRSRSKETIDILMATNEETIKITDSEFDYKKHTLAQYISLLKNSGIEETKIYEYALAANNRIEEDKTLEIKRQAAARLKVEGDTLGALKMEQQVSLVDFKRKWGAEGEAVSSFTKAQDAIRQQTRLTELGLKNMSQIQKDFFKGAIEDMRTSMSNFFQNAFMGQIKSAKKTFAEFGESLIKTFSDAVASMAANWLIFGTITGTGKAGTAMGGLLGLFGGKFHQGGIVRAHGGLAIDEVPIIAQSGERVLSRKQNAQYEQGMSNPGVVLVMKFWDFADVRKHAQEIRDIVAEGFRRNSSLRSSVKQYI